MTQVRHIILIITNVIIPFLTPMITGLQMVREGMILEGNAFSSSQWDTGFNQNQVESRSHPAPSYWDKSWSKRYSGRGEPDWIVKQYNEHCRARYSNSEIFSCGSSW